MASNNDQNSVKHKINGLEIKFSRTKNKWMVRDGNRYLSEGNIKECKKFCKQLKKTT